MVLAVDFGLRGCRGLGKPALPSLVMVLAVDFGLRGRLGHFLLARPLRRRHEVVEARDQEKLFGSGMISWEKEQRMTKLLGGEGRVREGREKGSQRHENTPSYMACRMKRGRNGFVGDCGSSDRKSDKMPSNLCGGDVLATTPGYRSSARDRLGW